jgi:hypothetical protein
MKTLLTIIILCCAFVSQAQTPPSPASSPSTATPSVDEPLPSASPSLLPTSNAPTATRAVVLPPEKARPVRVPRFEKKPLIDGRLSEEVWQQAAVLRNFYQVQPGDNIAPSRLTEVLLGYSDEFLYIAFRAHDEPEQVRATVPGRDDIFNDDYVGCYLDTFNDQRKAYELFFNALGVQGDGVLTEGRGEDFGVDIVMESKGVLTADGYTVEVAIPFKSLRYQAGASKLWGVQFFRRIKRFNNELDSWMPLSRDRSGSLNQAGHITGLENISAGRLLEIIPSLTFSETGDRLRTISTPQLIVNPALLDPGRFVNQPVNSDPGLSLKLGITPTTTLDLALNPDFAQIEADQVVVTANQRFPIFFPEKRPFFLEGIDIFRTQLNAVNTRAIVDPDAAVKLTGKRGRDTFGILLASDNAPGNFTQEERNDTLLRPRIERFLDKNAYIGILRLKHDVGKESSLGLIATSYNFIEKHSHLGGFDGRFRINPQTVFDFQILGTTSRRFFFDPERQRSVFRTGNGLGYFVRYDYAGRHFTADIAGAGRTRYYRTEVGFTRRFNTNQYEFFASYNSEPKPKAQLIAWHISNFTRTNFDFQRRMQNWASDVQFTFDLKRQTFFTFRWGGGYERLFQEEFRRLFEEDFGSRAGAFSGNRTERSGYKTNFAFTAQTTPNKKYSASISTIYTWGAFDFDLGAGPRFPRVSAAALLNPFALLDPGLGNSLEANASFLYRPTDPLSVTLDYTKSKLIRDDTGRVAFDDNIYALRLIYQFTRFTAARARIDYDTLASNVRGQFLIGWTPNPGTSLYIGYNDNLNYNGFNPFTGQLESSFRRNTRTFFIKMSYLIRRNF